MRVLNQCEIEITSAGIVELVLGMVVGSLVTLSYISDHLKKTEELLLNIVLLASKNAAELKQYKAVYGELPQASPELSTGL